MGTGNVRLELHFGSEDEGNSALGQQYSVTDTGGLSDLFGGAWAIRAGRAPVALHGGKVR